MKIRCPGCLTSIRLRGERPYGKTIRVACPSCDQSLRVKVPAKSAPDSSRPALDYWSSVFGDIMARHGDPLPPPSGFAP